MYKRFKEFHNTDALAFGLKVLEIVHRKQLKPVRIRVFYDGDVVFQYLMDDKKGEEWLIRKQNTVFKTGHSGMYVYEHAEEYKELENDDNYVICGGGYPLYIDDTLKGAFIVSGLAHDEDHQLIVDALNEMEG